MEELEDKKTEQWALEEEQREREWQETYGRKAGDYIRKLDQLLAKGTRESRMEIKSMFLDPDFFQPYKQVDIFAVMYVVMSIFELEDAEGIEQTILEQAHTVEGLQDYIFQFKMLMYRLDFGIEIDVEQQFLWYLKEHKVSPVQLGVMITTTAMRPLMLTLKLEKIFEKSGLSQYLFFILNFIQEHWGGNYRVIFKLEDICRNIGDEMKANQFADCVPNIPENMMGQRQTFLQVQELLWKVMYKEEEAEKELADFLQREKVTDDVWEFLLEHMEALNKDYYLCLANILLETRMTAKAEIALKFGLRMEPGDELILCLLAEQSVNRGEIVQAQEYLSAVTNPGELTVRFRELCRR